MVSEAGSTETAEIANKTNVTDPSSRKENYFQMVEFVRSRKHTTSCLVLSARIPLSKMVFTFTWTPELDKASFGEPHSR